MEAYWHIYNTHCSSTTHSRVYPGATAAEALDAMARDAGHKDYAEAEEICGLPHSDWVEVEGPYSYLEAAAAADERIMPLIREIQRHSGRGDVVLAEQAIRTLEDLTEVYGGEYTVADVMAVR